MNLKSLVGKSLRFFALAAVVLTSVGSVSVFAVENVDSVFIDEGDGDFEILPAQKTESQGFAQREQADSAEAGKDQSSQAGEDAPKSGSPVAASELKRTASKTPKIVARVKEKRELMKPARELAAIPKPSVPKEGKPMKLAVGLYGIVKDACPMRKEKDQEANVMLTLRVGKRIWVERIDEEWVRGYNKAREPGYIRSTCLTEL